MGYSIPIKDGILSLCHTDFQCPMCDYLYHEEDWYDKYMKAKSCVIYLNCKGCKGKIGLTTDMRGDVRVWDKKTEKK